MKREGLANNHCNELDSSRDGRPASGCRAVKFYSCNNLLSSVHNYSLLATILKYVRLNSKGKYYYYIMISMIMY